jgi:hypothetical protein
MSYELGKYADNCVSDLEVLQESCKNEFSRIDSLLDLQSSDFPSDIKPIDIAFPIIYGTIGSFISTSEDINKFLSQIHNQASSKEPKTFLGKIFHHFDDRIDQVLKDGEKIYVKRDGISKPDINSHRVMFGHDPFSLFHGDNPFDILIQQHGVLKGILRVFQHLVGDTFSKQGLPIPFHSYFDFYKDGKLSNRLLEFAKNCARDANESGKEINHGQAFNQLFTIKASDIISTGLTWTLCLIHNKLRGFQDPVQKSQTKIIGFSSQLFSKIIIGYCRTGVPMISWPTLSALLKQIFTFFRANYSDIKRLEEITDQLVSKNRELERTVFEVGKDLKSYSKPEDYILELDRNYRSFTKLANAFED